MAGAAEGRTDAWYFLEVRFVEFVDDRYWLQDAAPESSDVPCFTTRDVLATESESTRWWFL